MVQCNEADMKHVFMENIKKEEEWFKNNSISRNSERGDGEDESVREMVKERKREQIRMRANFY